MHWISTAGAHLVLNAIVAVHVLDEVAIDAVHALFQVDVHQVDGDARLVDAVLRRQVLEAHGGLQFGVADVLDDLAVVVEEAALAVLAEDGAEGPAVAVEVGELRVLAPPCSGRGRLSRNAGSDRLLRAADLVGVGRSATAMYSSAVGCLPPGG